MNILIINNEDTLINEIINCSINHNLNIFKCKDIKKINNHIHKQNIDIIILDIDCLNYERIECFKLIKTSFNKPIIIISSDNNTYNIVLFFSLGADDYVVKPLSTKELIMRIQAIYNRNK